MPNYWSDIESAACDIEGIQNPPDLKDEEVEEEGMDRVFYSSLLEDGEDSVDSADGSTSEQPQGSDCPTILRRFQKIAGPYWFSEDRIQGRTRLALVLLLSLATTAISVSYSFLGRDFYSALANKDAEKFKKQLILYSLAFLGGIPVFVLRDYMKDLLVMRWRSWMTNYYMELYFENRCFYNIETLSLMNNPDQRIIADVNSFTKMALDFALSIFNATVDLISFSSILYTIYPPLFLVLIGYSFTGTLCSVLLGKNLMGLNFIQEKTEGDLKNGILRVKENAESIAFYGGEKSQIQHLVQCFKQSMDNLTKLLIISRNLNFFTSAYRYYVQLLPAAIVAPIYFGGKIDFGVISQSFAAFDHILGDLSIVVYQFQSITAFTGVVDRLGEFSDIISGVNRDEEEEPSLSSPLLAAAQPKIKRIEVFECSNTFDQTSHTMPLLYVDHLTLHTPEYTMVLIEDLTFSISQGENLLIMGPSGSGKTSLLRAIAGLWQSGRGIIRTYMKCCENQLPRVIVRSPRCQKQLHQEEGMSSSSGACAAGTAGSEPGPSEIQEEENGGERRFDQWIGRMVFYLPQKTYLVQGSLRQQLLFPTWIVNDSNVHDPCTPYVQRVESGQLCCTQMRPPPRDQELYRILARVKLCHLESKCGGLDLPVEWHTMLSQAEQQRLAFARLLLARPRLAFLDESTSAMEEENEAQLYREVQAMGTTFVSVAHSRGTLARFHTNILTLASTDTQDGGYTWSMRSSLCQSCPFQQE